ncbi:hypothetical protein, partial [Salmonella sp. SJTUF15574]|uniref:hypothetical protein n=1 Tax=unclassified Salmonella TaxID=2614656 RepID=UPI003728BB60
RARLVVSLYEQKPKHEKQGQSIKGALIVISSRLRASPFWCSPQKLPKVALGDCAKLRKVNYDFSARCVL